MSAAKTHSTLFSKMQSAFIASSTLKRNKRYLDIERIKGQEQNDHLRRRKPRNSSKSVEAKINRSFSNSTAALTERLEKDIHKFRLRFNSQERPATAQSFYTRNAQNSPPKSAKGVGIGQHLSRQQYYKVRSKPVLDQRMFNNFKLQTPDQIHTADLGRGPQRDFDNSHKHINKDLEYNTQKLYQDYYFKRTTMDCRLHYRKQKEQERYFFVPKREENKPATDLSPKNIKKAEEAVRIENPVDSFYMNSGRQLPCQLEQRTGTALTSHWRNRQNVIERPFPEYLVRSFKQKLCDERKQRISESKRPHFERGEVCDKKFFLITGQGY